MKIQAVQIDRNTEGDREITPPFRCFACHDGGLAGGKFLKEFVDGDSDIPFICNRDQCQAGRRRYSAWSANDDEQYRNSFDTRLDRYACEDLHKWGKHEWEQDLKKRLQQQPPAQSIAEQFAQEVSDRERQIADIKVLLMNVDELTAKRIEGFVQKYRDRDQVNYPNWEALPTTAHKVLIENLRRAA
jgi:hypothetical protein